MLLEKWCQQTYWTQGCHKTSVCKKQRIGKEHKAKYNKTRYACIVPPNPKALGLGAKLRIQLPFGITPVEQTHRPSPSVLCLLAGGNQHLNILDSSLRKRICYHVSFNFL